MDKMKPIRRTTRTGYDPHKLDQLIEKTRKLATPRVVHGLPAELRKQFSFETIPEYTISLRDVASALGERKFRYLEENLGASGITRLVSRLREKKIPLELMAEKWKHVLKTAGLRGEKEREQPSQKPVPARHTKAGVAAEKPGRPAKVPQIEIAKARLGQYGWQISKSQGETRQGQTEKRRPAKSAIQRNVAPQNAKNIGRLQYTILQTPNNPPKIIFHAPNGQFVREVQTGYNGTKYVLNPSYNPLVLSGNELRHPTREEMDDIDTGKSHSGRYGRHH
ncbi:Uncharacterised protein [uncultured archaeon]|nr:Uncharacterised protein [uncultured archaeon]